MSKTIKTPLLTIQQKIKIFILKNRIKKMERISYLNLWERMELRDTIKSLQNLQQQRGIQNTAFFSVY